MVSIYETSILNQVVEWKRLLNTPLPIDLAKFNFTKRIGFTGTGSSYWAARISEFLWRDYVSWNSLSLQSYDFVRSKYLVSPKDIIVVFSPRGTKNIQYTSFRSCKENW